MKDPFKNGVLLGSVTTFLLLYRSQKKRGQSKSERLQPHISWEEGESKTRSTSISPSPRVFKARKELQKPLGTCPICKKDIFNTQPSSQCPECKTLFHSDHLGEWVKKNGTCPYCKEDIIDITE